MNSLFTNDLTGRLKQTGVVAVLVVDQAADAVPLAQTLVEAGIDVMELTLRTPAALEALQLVRRQVPRMVCGIGTILTPEQVAAVKDAGAAFGVAPGINRRVVEQALRVRLPFAPGIATPSEIEIALEYGCRILKFFPAEACGGLTYLKNASAPYAHLGLRYMPLGGINAANMKAYLADPMIMALGGSWIAPRDLIRQKDWKKIDQNAREARALLEQVRKGGAQ
jgi:2-dehydro-3-deoxyphosphogluconate aldolase / (4S)-4-hydroxy-2-oxoglutarate aldolase